MAFTAVLDQFLLETSRILRDRDGAQLQDYLLIEPPYKQIYNSMIAELRATHPRGTEDKLEVKCGEALPEARNGEDGIPWTAFLKFMVQYLGFIRDVNIQNLLDTYNLLSELVQKCNSALVHPSLGIVILPTVVTYSQMLARLAIGLDKKPELIAHLTTQSTDEGGSAETLPERAANIIRQAFVTCLNDRTAASSGIINGVPDGKRIGIYKIANVCLKVLFSCRKTRNAEQIFTNIYNQSPPLAAFPRAQRVTYLFYLGRFMFSNNHFYRAYRALQSAYLETYFGCLKQRRLILIPLMATSIILGRFPKQSLFTRPEAAGLAEIFQPLCSIIAKGDLAGFRRLLDLSNPRAVWLIQNRVYLQLLNRCEVLVWRSLVRQVFILNGNRGDSERKRAPTLSLEDVLAIANRLEHRVSSLTAESNSFANSTKQAISGNSQNEDYTDPDYEDDDDKVSQGDKPSFLDMLEIESIFTALVSQGLLNGYISHSQSRFAIQGAKKAGPMNAGFPNIWESLKSKAENEVPGWKERFGPTANGTGVGQLGPGSVLNLSGARPPGALA